MSQVSHLQPFQMADHLARPQLCKLELRSCLIATSLHCLTNCLTRDGVNMTRDGASLTKHGFTKTAVAQISHWFRQKLSFSMFGYETLVNIVID